MAVYHFLNLSNGIEAIGKFGLRLADCRFIRIQSTWCEQKRWDDILMGLSDDFLMRSARGDECHIYDASEQHDTPRAIWQGLEFVKFAIMRRWWSKSYCPVGRCTTSMTYFTECYNALDNRTLRRIDFFAPYSIGEGPKWRIHAWRRNKADAMLSFLILHGEVSDGRRGTEHAGRVADGPGEYGNNVDISSSLRDDVWG